MLINVLTEKALNCTNERNNIQFREGSRVQYLHIVIGDRVDSSDCDTI